MTQAQEQRDIRRSGAGSARKMRGFSLVEVIMAMLIGSILTAAAIPSVKSGINNYRLNSAVAMAKWSIQSTRFQALAKGYPYQVVFNATNANYQIQNLPSGTTYANVGSTVPLASWPMTFSANTTINFLPNGFVTATVGSNIFSITYQGSCQVITVSNYGNVGVTTGTIGTSPC
jgi:prepilin-type N-terminal cleavage/methylation domain-containing protein